MLSMPGKVMEMNNILKVM